MLPMKGFLESKGREIQATRTRYEKYSNSFLGLGDTTSSLKRWSITLFFFVMNKWVQNWHTLDKEDHKEISICVLGLGIKKNVWPANGKGPGEFMEEKLVKLNWEDSGCFLKLEPSQNQWSGIFCISLLFSTIMQLLTLWQKPSKAGLNHTLSYSMSLDMFSPIVHSSFSLSLHPWWAIVPCQIDVGLSSQHIQQKLHEKTEVCIWHRCPWHVVHGPQGLGGAKKPPKLCTKPCRSVHAYFPTEEGCRVFIRFEKNCFDKIIKRQRRVPWLYTNKWVNIKLRE